MLYIVEAECSGCCRSTSNNIDRPLIRFDPDKDDYICIYCGKSATNIRVTHSRG